MMVSRHALFALLASLCLVLAGCSAAPAGSDGTRTVNPALETTPSASPTAERSAGPPGVDDDVRVSVLVAAHEDALENRSVVVRSNTTATFANGTVVERTTLRSVARGDQQYLRYQLPVSPYTFPHDTAPNQTVWRNETVAVVRNPTADGDVETTVHSSPFPREIRFDPSGSDVLDRVLAGLELTASGETVVEGERLHVLTAANADQPSLPTHSNLSVRALVTDAGVVRSLSISYRVPQYAGVDQSTTISIRFRTATGAGTPDSVPRPEWVDATLTNGTERTATATSD